MFFEDVKAQGGLNDTLQMQEVVIRSNNAVYWNRDTTVYVADSFNRSPHNMAEDVLKKLPGIDVSMDGKITVEGKEVKRIFINGKEASVGDIRSLTQNMPASIISQVQLTDLLSDEAQALGLKESNTEKIINLKLKDEYNNGVYGRAAAGGGNDGLYQSSLFSNYMAGTSRITATGYANNTGNADISSGTDAGSGGRNAGTAAQENININYSYKTPDNKLDLSGTAELGSRRSTTQQSSLKRTYLPGDSILYQSQQSANSTSGTNARFSIRGLYTFSKHTSLNTTLGINSTRSSPVQNTQDTTAYNDPAAYSFTRNASNTSADDNPSVNLSTMLQRNSRKQGRNFVARYNMAYSATTRESIASSTNLYHNAPATFNNTSTDQDNYTLSNNLLLKAAEPLSTHSIISAEYGLQQYTSKDNRDVTVTNSQGQEYADSIQSNNYEYDFTEHNIGLQYQYNKERISFNAGMKAQPFERSNRNTAKKQEATYNGTNYFPMVGLRYNLTKRAKLDANYSGSMRAPSINQVQPAPDYSDSLNIIIGNPNLRPEVSSSMNIAYNYLHAPKERNFWARLGYNRTDDKIVNQTTISANKRISMPVNADGVYNATASLGYGYKWKKRYRLRLGLNSGMGSNIIFTNNVRQQVLNYHYQPNTGLSILTEKLETELTYSLRSSYTSGSSISSNNRLMTHTLAYDLKWNLPGNLTIAANLNYTINNGLSAGYNQNFVLANASIYKGFSKPVGLYVRLQGYDLLNNYPNTRRTVTDNMIEDRSFNRIGRYFLVSAIYKFSHFFK